MKDITKNRERQRKSNIYTTKRLKSRKSNETHTGKDRNTVTEWNGKAKGATDQDLDTMEFLLLKAFDLLLFRAIFF